MGRGSFASGPARKNGGSGKGLKEEDEREKEERGRETSGVATWQLLVGPFKCLCEITNFAPPFLKSYFGPNSCFRNFSLAPLKFHFNLNILEIFHLKPN